MNLRKFSEIQRTHEHGSFGAFEYAYSQFESLENMYPAEIYVDDHSYDFLINEVNQTALYKKCIMRNSK